jgi:hypothetical protein
MRPEVPTASRVGDMPGLSPYRGSPDSSRAVPYTGRPRLARSRPRGAWTRREVANATRQAHRCGARFTAGAGSCRRRTLPPLAETDSWKPGPTWSRASSFSLRGWVRWENGNYGRAQAWPARHVEDPSSRFGPLGKELEPEVEISIDRRGIEADSVVRHNEPRRVPFTRERHVYPRRL